MMPVWPLILYFAAIVALISLMLGVSYILGTRRLGKARSQPFESGIVSVGSARLRFPAKFYLVAMLFVIFDLEAVFITAWAISFKYAGWAGYIENLIFIGILIAALVYLWRIGALDWGPSHNRSRRQAGY